MAVPLPAGKQVEVKATGRKGEVFDQATMISEDVQFIGPHGFKWTHWRLTENEKNNCDLCKGVEIDEANLNGLCRPHWVQVYGNEQQKSALNDGQGDS